MRARRIFTLTSALALVLVGLVFPAPAKAVALSCGTNLNTPNTTVVLTADVGPCTNTIFGIAVTAPGIVLDLNGHTVTGDFTQGDDFATFGIYVTPPFLGSLDGVTVKNGTVRGFNAGMYIEETTNATVTGMRLLDNVGPDPIGFFGDGLQIFRGGSHTITNNIVANNGPYSGIVAYDSSNNVISNNNVSNNNLLDTSGHHGSEGAIMQDIGIWVINLSPGHATRGKNHTVANNQVTANGLDGIQVSTFTTDNTVRANNASGNGFGQPNGNGFRDGDGIAIFGSSNLFETNTANSNGGNGIAVQLQAGGGNPANGKNNTIRFNRAIGNGSEPNSVAFDLKDGNTSPPCDANTWFANQFGTRNQPCVS